jgi:hypothetical protein
VNIELIKLNGVRRKLCEEIQDRVYYIKVQLGKTPNDAAGYDLAIKEIRESLDEICELNKHLADVEKELHKHDKSSNVTELKDKRFTEVKLINDGFEYEYLFHSDKNDRIEIEG